MEEKLIDTIQNASDPTTAMIIAIQIIKDFLSQSLPVPEQGHGAQVGSAEIA